MTLDQIKQAIAEGKSVKWANDAYDVIRSTTGEYLIVCSLNQNAIGLTWTDGVTINGKPEDFYIAKTSAEIYAEAEALAEAEDEAETKAKAEALQATIEQMKAEIFTYIQQAVIPSTVASFSELHDYIDANCLGGFCDDDSEINARILELQDERDSLTEEEERNWPNAGELDELQEEQTAFINAAQNAIDAWIKSGGCKRPVWDSSGFPEGEAKRAAEAKAARSWCYVFADGANFYVSRSKAERMQAKDGGKVFPPDHTVRIKHEIEALQNIMKKYPPTSNAWKQAQELINPLFAEMARIAEGGPL